MLQKTPHYHSSFPVHLTCERPVPLSWNLTAFDIFSTRYTLRYLLEFGFNKLTLPAAGGGRTDTRRRTRSMWMLLLSSQTASSIRSHIFVFDEEDFMLLFLLPPLICTERSWATASESCTAFSSGCAHLSSIFHELKDSGSGRTHGILVNVTNYH